jgi:hypothetical protein
MVLDIAGVPTVLHRSGVKFDVIMTQKRGQTGLSLRRLLLLRILDYISGSVSVRSVCR